MLILFVGLILHENSLGMQAGPTMLDGNLLAQFLELTTMQQELVLTSPSDNQSSGAAMPDSSHPSQSSIPVSEVVRVLERVHYALD